MLEEQVTSKIFNHTSTHTRSQQQQQQHQHQQEHAPTVFCSSSAFCVKSAILRTTMRLAKTLSTMPWMRACVPLVGLIGPLSHHLQVLKTLAGGHPACTRSMQPDPELALSLATTSLLS
jgi:hypothetical protein